jgi:hypothetical protein
MNKIKLFTGGYPIGNDEFDFLQSANLEAFKGLLSSLTPDGYLILSGMEITLISSTPQGDVYEVSEGWMSYGYEVIYCPFQSVAVSQGAYLEALIETQYPASGTVTFLDNKTRQIHEVRTILVQEYSQNGVDLSNVNRVNQSIESILATRLNQQSVSTLQGTAVNLKATRQGNIVKLQGAIQVNANISNFTLVASLPTGWRPPHDCHYAAIVEDAGTYYPAYLKVRNDGIVVAWTDVNSVVERVYLDTVQFCLY